MCGFFDSTVNAVGQFLSSPAGKVITAVATIAVAAITLNPFAIVAAVGSTLGAIGAVTGNKTISTIGSVIGAVGMIGGLANAAGILDVADVFGSDIANWSSSASIFGSGGEAASSFGSSGAGELGLPTGGPTAGYDDVGQLMAAQGIGGQPSDVGTFDALAGQISDTPGPVSTAETPNVTPAVTTDAAIPQGDGPPTMNSPSDALRTAGRPDDINAPAGGYGFADNSGAYGGLGSTGTSPAIPTGTVSTNAAANSIIYGGSGSSPSGFGATRLPSQIPTGVNAPLTPPSDMWGGISKWVEGHPSLALGGLMAAGSFLSGATSPLTPAQVSAYEAQAEQNRAAANLANQQAQVLATQQANMRAPLPVASRTPTGLINMPKLAPVTGQVAT